MSMSARKFLTASPTALSRNAARFTGWLGAMGLAASIFLGPWPGPLTGAEPAKPAAPEKKVRVLLVTGIDYPGHIWRQTAPVIRDALTRDSRLEVFTIEDPHFLDSSALARYDVMVMHWQNWEQPGPGVAARTNLHRGAGIFNRFFKNSQGVFFSLCRDDIQ